MPEVYERVRKFVITVCLRTQRGQQMHFVGVKKSR